MPKKERIFPIDTVGGRIQHKRHELGISRSKLYDLVYNIAEKSSDAGSESSKEKTVFHWESNKTQLDYNTLKAMCKTLQCSSDYLLGLDECSNKTYQFIHDETGLSEKAIKQLHKFTTYDKGKPRLFILDYFIRNVKFSLYLTDKIKDYFDKRDRYKRWEKKFLQEEEEQRNLDIFELLEYPQTISRSKLKEYENVKDAAHFQVQKDFDDILEIFIKYLDKYNIQIPDTNQDME